MRMKNIKLTLVTVLISLSLFSLVSCMGPVNVSSKDTNKEEKSSDEKVFNKVNEIVNSKEINIKADEIKKSVKENNQYMKDMIDKYNIDDLKDEIKDIKESINNINSSVDKEKIQSSIDEISKSIDNLILEINLAEGDKDNVKENLQKTISTLGNQLDKLSVNFDKLNIGKDEIKEDIEEIKNNINIFTNLFK